MERTMPNLIPTPRYLVTVPHSAEPKQEARAMELARRLGLPYCPRRGKAVPELLEEYGVDLLVVSKGVQIELVGPSGRYGFHPNMALHRLAALKAGKPDRLVDVAGLCPGDKVLDCTCGLGSDAIVASHAVGPRGKVRALEASPVLAAMVAGGLASYTHREQDLVEAMRRVDVCPGHSDEILASEATDAWDVVYFDPMFERTIEKTKGLDGVRMVATPGLPSSKTIKEARRVARRCVVVKDRRPGDYLNAMGIPVVSDVKQVWYGRMESQALSAGRTPSVHRVSEIKK